MILRALAVLSLAALPSHVLAQGKGQLIVHQLSGKCLDIAGAPGVANGAKAILYDCERSGRNANGSQSDQYWEFTAGGFIRNTLSGKCLDVSGAPGTANGAPLQLWDCENSGRASNGTETDQRWVKRADGAIMNEQSLKCIDVSGAPGIANGAKVQLWDCENSGRTANGATTDQRWRY